MSIKKEKIVPNIKVVIDRVSDAYYSPMVLMSTPGGSLDGVVVPQLGEEIKILSKPKMHDGINSVCVSYKNKEYYAYYASIRYCTSKCDNVNATVV